MSIAGKLFAKGKLSILIYHQVFETQDMMRPTEPDKATFDWQMQLLKRYFTPLSLNEAIERLKNNSLPANAVCITFDDGYLNNLTVAAPILKKYDIPATVYCATAFANGENMWNDRLIDLVGAQELEVIDLSPLGLPSMELVDIAKRRATAEKLIGEIKYKTIVERKQLVDELYRVNQLSERPSKMMSPEQIKELFQLGVDIGAHTVDHPIMHVLSEEEQQHQVEASKSKLEEWISASISGFAYPNGKLNVDYDEKTCRIVESSSFDYAVTTNWGTSTQGTDVFQLNRFTPWDTSPAKFHLRLTRNLLGLM